MALYFFDSSAVVKRYSVEAGSKWTFDVLRPSAGHTIFVAAVTGVETVAALARKRRGNRLTVHEAAKAIGRFRRHFARRYQKLTITDGVVAAAMVLADKHELRGYDAVQLSAALKIEAERAAVGAPPLIFVSADDDLNGAAQTEGLKVANPNRHP